VFKLSDHTSILIPFLNSYPPIGLKAYNYNIWVKIIALFEKGAHLTSYGLKRIKQLMSKLNLWE